MEVIEKRKELRRKIIETASSWVTGLNLKVTAVLIGSYARGDFNLWSDVDLLMVSTDFEGGPIERLKKLQIPAGFQVIPLTTEEFNRLLIRGEKMATEAFNSGIILRDDLKIFRRGGKADSNEK
ncbi:nucleotidyltransferase domain-containing protein [Candidatus Bathyarchaeota archaeon]|nr:nucleotidyltransferase domain-containing protein [Candidatus Bathyarchaeota archaeon]